MTHELPTRARRLSKLVAVTGALAAYVAITAFLAHRYSDLPPSAQSRFEVRGGWIYRDGEKFLVKGVGWDPTRPGELPWTRRRAPELIEEDFARIRAARFNTIRSWEVLSAVELAAAERQGLAVLQGIWVKPDGPFADPAFRRSQLERVANAVRASRGSRAVIAYLVMNEPEPAHVLAEGVDVTRSFLRELAATVRREDEGALVAFSSWPGLEFLDEPSLDFVAANLYPFRPSSLIESIGYGGMVRLWKRLPAGNRPLLVTEFGISVAPSSPLPDGPGGATEAEQARALPQLAEAIVRNGAAGSAAFMWIDGWWKNSDAPGDENTRNPNDGEEWFGLVAMESLSDSSGRARPVLRAMADWNRAVLTLPHDGPVSSREVEVEAHVEEEGARIEVSIDGAAATVVPVVREGPWLRGRIGLAAQARGPQRLLFRIIGPDDETWKISERVVVPPGEGVSLKLRALTTGSPRRVAAQVTDRQGRPLAGAVVRISVAEPSREFDEALRLETNARGEAFADIDLPPAPGFAVVAGAVEGSGDEAPLAMDAQMLSRASERITAESR
jgi:exo-beta-1,3-glucanase (GH17 family)